MAKPLGLVKMRSLSGRTGDTSSRRPECRSIGLRMKAPDYPDSKYHEYGAELAVWWLRLGIEIERIKPGHPTQNGRHERIHLTLKKEATKPAAHNLLQQQARFDDFIECYNCDRPHQALDMKYPAELYRPSPRPYLGLREHTYPFHDRPRRCERSLPDAGALPIDWRPPMRFCSRIRSRVQWPTRKLHIVPLVAQRLQRVGCIR